MPLDALCLTAVAGEVRAAVQGGKIDKIYQPTRDEVVLYIRRPAPRQTGPSLHEGRPGSAPQVRLKRPAHRAQSIETGRTTKTRPIHTLVLCW